MPDNSETIKISSLALMKMLRHGKAGVPFEVMGIMLGEYVDEYKIEVKDVFAMPTIATTVSVESVDPVYQTRFMEMMK
jgi:26S proteasome regulatory subunit N11